MTTKSKIGIAAVLIFALSTCKRNNTAETIPTGPVSITIDLNLPTYQYLNTVGAFGYFQGGKRGVVLVHNFDDNWFAFERTCAWQPLNECSTIWVDSMLLQFQCGTYSGSTFSQCCESRYQFDGLPSKGPAKGPLVRYNVQKNGSILYISN